MQSPVNIHNRSSNNHYNVLDTRFHGRVTNKRCNDLDAELVSQYKSHHGISLFCSRLIGNLSNYSTLPNLYNVQKLKCQYFNLWIYERLPKELGKVDDEKSQSIINKIKDIWNDYNLKETCSWDFISYINEINYIKIKQLYDYALNYSVLLSHFDVQKKTCTDKDKQLILENIKLYELVKRECETNSDTGNLLCTALGNIRSIYTNDELSKLTCNGKISNEDIQRVVQNSLTQPISNPAPDGGEIPSSDDDGRIVEEFISGAITPEEPSLFSTSSKATSVVFPLVSTVFIFFSLYKLTPAGSWLHSRLLRNKIVPLNANAGETNEILENTFDSVNKNVTEYNHHVGYLPS
ncbi:PIR Superfamily Protein [Plasmodium ovale wallikeri]|uniref:PIR Superfamily Protein n=1 Tax=Plasmodium ovale wallikeri TaxID=864142 RepID=A0A1A9A8A5_PLAOA|nr:PIR Superfamily Protein [Plasmodium ovale wallikeri]SBT55561.1 PIR Superfamily Protein [Plasmodium ovale wallikeri]